MRLSVERAEMRLPVTLEVLENGLDVKIRFGWELQSFSSQMSSLKWGNGLSCQNQNHLWSRDIFNKGPSHTLTPHRRAFDNKEAPAAVRQNRERRPLFGRTESACRCSGEPRAPAAAGAPVRENQEAPAAGSGAAAFADALHRLPSPAGPGNFVRASAGEQQRRETH